MSLLGTSVSGQSGLTKIFPLIENYIYLYHTDTLILIPAWPDTVNDSQQASYNQTPILGRSAPIQAYSGTGARSLQFAFSVHREMLKQTNMNSGYNSGVALMEGEDYTETMINLLYGSVIPNYAKSSKLVDPPLAAARFGNNFYIKGVVTAFSAAWKGPILRDNKYAVVDLSISITEINPYDAVTAMGVGPFRSDGEIKMSTELNKSTYMLGKTVR